MNARLTKTVKELWNDESAQGATEYILLLVAVVAVLAIFREKITSLLEGKLNDVASKIQGFGQ